jgi:predicted dithiol-disulfide oxidoreductase (DUF899 family)
MRKTRFTPAIKDSTMNPGTNPEGDNDSQICSLYLQQIEGYDAKRLKRWNSDMDVVLVFVSKTPLIKLISMTWASH